MIAMIVKRAHVPVMMIAMSAGVALGDQAPTTAANVTATPSITLMTYNVNYADHGRDETMAAIEAGAADVVLLQEVTSSWEKQLRKRFARAYPHRVFHPDPRRRAGGFAVLSKFPISDDAILPPAEGWFPAHRFVLDTPLGALDVLNLHLRPAILDGSWIKGYFGTPPIRRREIEAYWTQLPRLPAIVAGDFNEEPGKDVGVFLADRGMTRIDTGGAPTSWSYTGRYAGQDVSLSLDIDHVVIAPALTSTAATVLDAGKSDHRPVVVTLTKATPTPREPTAR